MAHVHPAFVALVVDRLGGLREVSYVRFFGGIALRCGRVQFGMIMRDSLYLIVDEDTRQRYEEMGMGPFSYQTSRGTRALRHYRQVPPDVVEDRETLCRWAADALEAAAANAGTAVRHPRQRDDG